MRCGWSVRVAGKELRESNLKLKGEREEPQKARKERHDNAETWGSVWAVVRVFLKTEIAEGTEGKRRKSAVEAAGRVCVVTMENDSVNYDYCQDTVLLV